MSRPPIQVNVPPAPPRHNSVMAPNGVQTYSADRALQYTPFTLSLLPLVDRIPIPEPSRARENGRVATSTERSEARHMLQQQNQSQQAVMQNKIAALLNGRNMTDYDFKLGPSTSGKQSRSTSTLVNLGLSSMARSILDMTKIEYRYPTPDEDSDATNGQAVKTSKTNGLPTPAEPNLPAAIAKVEQQQQTFNGTPVTKPPHQRLVIQVPAPPPSYSREDYVTIEHSPKKRKLSHDENEFRQTTTQKQQSDELLQSFQDVLTNIFEAQDRFDGSDLCSAKTGYYFEPFEIDGEDGQRLNLKTLDRLREDLRRLWNLRRLSDVPHRDLQRLQQLCEPHVEKGQAVNLRMTSDPSEDEIKAWQTSFANANHAMSCAIVLVYIMLGNPQQEALLSTEALHWSAYTLVNVMENCLVPVVEARPDATEPAFFRHASSNAETLKRLLNTSRRLLDLMVSACIDVKGGSTCVNTIEFLAAKLIFVQNATSEKNSALSLQVYETFRKSAMAAMSRIYARFPRERAAILDEVLSSLDKLPSTSRSARTFRASEGKSIQLISALFMQLVQTTAMEVPKAKHKKSRPKQRNIKGQDSDDEDMADGNDDDHQDVDEDKDMDSADETDPVARLDRKVEQLFQPAARSAQDIVLYLVSKASKTTKTGDSPYRNILDLLVEDLINVLDSYDWPSAELLLNVLAVKMLDLAKNEKAASVKNMALESLGSMGSAISKLRARLPHVAASTKIHNNDAAKELSRLVDMYAQNGGVLPQDLISMRGPFVMVAQALQHIKGKATLHQESARGYFAAHFASLVSQTAHSSNVRVDVAQVAHYLVNTLTSSITQASSVDLDVSADMADAAYLLCILHLRFCRRLTDILKSLTSSLSSDQAQVRSRTLKSVSVILEIDSSLLDRDASIADDVFRCASDDSAMVRDSALSLIARFIIPRGGALERRGIERLLQCAGDEKIGVQKRSIGHLKEIFLHEQRLKVKTMIAQTLFRRLTDQEESIAALAEQTLEDILIKPVSALIQADENGASATVAVDDLASTLMGFVSDEPEVFVPLLKKLLAIMLDHDKKNFTSNQRLCSRLVHALFEKIIGTEKTKSPLLVLTALAEAEPKLVPPMQLSKLQVYLSDIQKENDLFMFRSAVDIFRLVLPDLSESHKNLLKDIQDRLMQAISKLARRLELDAVMQCLSTIDRVLHNTDRLVKLSSSVLNQLPSSTVPQTTLVKLLQIAGAMGKYIDLDVSLEKFQRAIPNFTAQSVSAYMTQTILPLTAQGRPSQVRTVALESLGSVCQASPAQLNVPKVRATFFNILKLPSNGANVDDYRLKSVVLAVFDELFASRAVAKERTDKAEKGEGQGLKTIGGDARSRDQDSAISAITMDVVEAVLRISLNETSDNALPAAKTLASISHQGLIHPKQCLGAFVAFGTSRNSAIADIGYEAQRLLHEQHESHCEREYMSAVVQASQFQRNIEKSPAGAIITGQTGFKAKLGRCFEIINTSNSKYVKKFLSGIVTRTTFDSSSSEKPLPNADHVSFTRFIMQNVAFFDYKKLDELLHVVLQLELAYSKTGGEIASFVETAQQQYPDLVVQQQVTSNLELGIEPTIIETKSIDPALTLELKRLSYAAAALMLLIETRSHLLRQYGVGRDVRAAMVNSKQAKDTNKVPTKVHGITGEKFWTKSNAIVTALENEDSSTQLCKDFLLAMSADDDFEMADETAFDRDAASADPDTSMTQRAATPGGRKRKMSATPGTTPTKKARGRPRKLHVRRSSSISSKEDPDADFAG